MSDSPAGRVPGWAIAPAVLGVLLVLVPVASMAARVDWPGLPALLTSESSVTALLLSLRTALASTVVCLVLGVPLALVLARGRHRGMRWLRALVLLPLVLPPVVGGLALLAAFGRTGLVGQYLEAGGIRIAFTTVAVVMAQAFVSMPFLVVGLEGALRSVGTEYEKVATTHGASPTRTLLRVTLPLVAPGLISGTVLAFARALGEFGATLTFAGSLQGTTRTLPLEIYLQREVDPDQALALSLLLIVVALGVVALVHNNPRPSRPSRRVVRRRQATAGTAAPRPAVRAGTLTWRGTLKARGHATELVVQPGETVAVVGANGAGKSTLVGLLAGLLHPDEGLLSVGGDVLVDTDDDTDVAPHLRRVVLLGQRPLLFPHMDVQGNAEFGPRSSGRTDPAAIARRALEDAGALQWATEPATALSGGQASRVALARALACSPRALLLDEPFAALDVASAPSARTALSEAVRAAGCPTVLVTHDLLDVLALADRIVVLEEGRVVESGTVADVLSAPTSAFAAELAGVNVMHGTQEADGVLHLGGGVVVHGRQKAPAPTGAAAFAVFPPSSVAVYLEPPHGSPRNVLAAEVAALADQGGAVRVTLALENGAHLRADLTAAAVADLGLRPGRHAFAVVKAQEVGIHLAPEASVRTWLRPAP
ncbi:MAG: ABC transporter permease [Arachnia sp.]